MIRYPILMLDADNTLMDFEKAEEFSFFYTCKAHGIPADEALLERYKTINSAYWAALEQKKITKPDLIVRRFADLFSEKNIDADPAQFNFEYLDNLALGNALMEDADAVCRELASCCRIIVATNGVSRAQHRRIDTSPLAPYVEQLVVSEDAGAEKPDPDFFRYGFKVCGLKESDKDKVLMVGDSLTADVAGGIAYGLDTCWYNYKGVENSRDIRPTYEIRHLRDLIPLVKGN